MKSSNNKKNILMISYVFPPFFSIGGSIRVVKFIKYLSQLRWKPSVLTIDDCKEYDTQKKVGSEILFKDIPDRVKIYRTSKSGEPSAAFIDKGRELRRKNPILAPVINLLGKIRGFIESFILIPDQNVTWAPYAIRLGRKIIKDQSISLIFATCPPHSAGIIGAILKQLTGKPLILDYRDDWIDTPWFKKKLKIIQLIERLLEKWIVSKADRIILVTEWSLKAFLSRYPDESENKFVIIPNGCDLEEFDSKKNYIEMDQDSKFFNIVHAGLLTSVDGLSRDLYHFFKAISKLKVRGESISNEIKVTFTGKLPEIFKGMIQKMGIQDLVRDVGHLPQYEYHQLLNQAHLFLTINYDGFSTLIPGKIYEYWAIGGPPILLLSCHGAARNLIEKNKLGVTVPSHDTELIQKVVLDLYSRWKKGMPMRITSEGIEEFDRRKLTEKLAKILNDVIEG